MHRGEDDSWGKSRCGQLSGLASYESKVRRRCVVLWIRQQEPSVDQPGITNTRGSLMPG